MMKILGGFDIITGAIFFIFATFHVDLLHKLVMILAIILLIKGLIFMISKDIASLLDIICAIIMFISLGVSMPYLIVILVFIYLLQKGIFSLLA